MGWGAVAAEGRAAVATRSAGRRSRDPGVRAAGELLDRLWVSTPGLLEAEPGDPAGAGGPGEGDAGAAGVGKVLVSGKRCPKCGKRTVRERMPWYLRPARKLLRGRISYRSCEDHHWKGLARGDE